MNEKPDLPPEVAALLREMQASGWTGSLTLHMVGGEVRTWDQRRSGRIPVQVLTRR